MQVTTTEFSLVCFVANKRSKVTVTVVDAYVRCAVLTALGAGCVVFVEKHPQLVLEGQARPALRGEQARCNQHRHQSEPSRPVIALRHMAEKNNNKIIVLVLGSIQSVSHCNRDSFSRLLF